MGLPADGGSFDATSHRFRSAAAPDSLPPRLSAGAISSSTTPGRSGNRTTRTATGKPPGFNFFKIHLNFVEASGIFGVEGSSTTRTGVSERTERKHPLLELDEADLEFVLRFVLASGSLKELGRSYGVSYPTIRARLDRLIERLQRRLQERPPDPLAELLAELVERGEMTVSAARAVQELSRKAYVPREEPR